MGVDMEITKIGVEQFATLILGTGIGFIVPIVIAIIWIIKKKEHYIKVIVGALTFLIAVLLLEKPLQALVVSTNTTLGAYINARPILLAFVFGLFPGVFEETGRFIAFKTALKKYQNKETAISYGIGHGGFEIMMLMGMGFGAYISYALMINTGTFEAMVEQVRQVSPEQVDSLYAIATALSELSLSNLPLSMFERVFAFIYHIAASILVFYACREKKCFFLYPLAIVLHTILDMFVSLYSLKVLNIPVMGLEIIIAVFSVLVFAGAYLGLYKKDQQM